MATTIGTLFQVSSGDYSSSFLCSILGPLGDNGTALPCASTLPSLLGTLSGVVNSVVLVVGVFMVLYVTIVGLLKTAQEGEFLGRQWRSIWVPLRMVLGIASLFPMGKGYCLIQVVFIWIIMHGVGAADSLWTAALQFVKTQGSPYANAAIPPGTAMQGMHDLMQAITCDNASRRTAGPNDAGHPEWSNLYYRPDGNNAQNYYYSAPGSPGPNNNYPTSMTSLGYTQGTDSNGNGTVTLNFGPNGSCGSVTFCDPSNTQTVSSASPTSTGVSIGKVGQSASSTCPAITGAGASTDNFSGGLTCAACLAQYNVMQQIIAGSSSGVNTYTTPGSTTSTPIKFLSFATIAEIFNTIDQEYLEFYNNTATPPAPDPTTLDFLQINKYCTAHNIPAPNSCCVAPPPSTNTNNSTGTSYSCQTPGQPGFPLPYIANGSSMDQTNSSADAVTNIYWPDLSAELTKVGVPTDMIGTAVKVYTNAVGDAMAQYITNWNTAYPVTTTGGWEDEASNDGWLFAGAYYNRMAKMQDNNVNGSIPTLVVTTNDPLTGNHDDLRGNGLYRTNYQAIRTIIDNSSQQTTNLPPAAVQMNSQLESSSAGILDSFENSLTNGNNPLTAVHQFGESLLITGEVLYIAFLLLMSIAIGAGGVNVMVLGTGLTENPLQAALVFLANALMPLLIFFIGFCFSFGGMLAFYLPMIPYIIFIVGGLGWIIAVIEAVFAAPFVALGILSPGGQHDLLGRAEPAMMMLLNTFIRPGLMIIGLIAAMLVAPVAVNLVNTTFSTAMGSVISNPGLIELIFIIVIYTFIIITVLNKVFTLIYVIPERVLTWIGGQVVSYGEAEALQAVKGGAEGAAGKVGGGASGQGSEMVKKDAELSKSKKSKGSAKTGGT